MPQAPGLECLERAMSDKERLAAFNAIGLEPWELQWLADHGKLKKPKIRNIDDVPLPPKGKNAAAVMSEKKAEKLFNVFWAEYPKKVARLEAFKAFKSNVKNEDTAAVMTAIVKNKVYSCEWVKGDKYIPNAATWIRGRRWEDEDEHSSAADDLMEFKSLKFDGGENETNY